MFTLTIGNGSISSLLFFNSSIDSSDYFFFFDYEEINEELLLLRSIDIMKQTKNYKVVFKLFILT